MLGYIVKVEAKKLIDRPVKKDEEYALDTDYATGESATINPSITITKQSTSGELDNYRDMVGEEADDFGFPDYTISKVGISDLGAGDYEVTIEITSDEYSKDGKKESKNYLKNQVEVSINYSEIVLEAKHLGYTRGVSGLEWVSINNPPTRKFVYDMDIDSLHEMNSSWTPSAVLSLLKTGKIGFSRVVAVYDQNLRPFTKSAFLALTDPSKIGKIRLTDYVYAQPSHKKSSGTSVTNVYFIPWVAKDSALIYRQKSHRTSFPQENGLDKTMKKSWIGKRIPVVEATVSKHYKGKASAVLKKWEHKFYTDAVEELSLQGISSYKTTSLSIEEVTDNTGKIWCKVTRTLAGLKGYYWNHNYSEGDLM